MNARSIKTIGAGLAILLLGMSEPVLSADIKPFTSDGCSAFPDGTIKQKQLWLSCCRTHDIAYWQGGAYMQRYKADKALQQCVSGVGQDEIATLMLLGVRVGGSPYLNTPFRWGYGWRFTHGYAALTDAEKKSVERELGKVDTNDSEEATAGK